MRKDCAFSQPQNQIPNAIPTWMQTAWNTYRATYGGPVYPVWNSWG